MIPRTAAETADLQRCRERQAATARQQAEHHAAMQRIWSDRAASYEAEATALATRAALIAQEVEHGR